ncbi:hypothetical protein BV898_10854 [Hypsibius exemplaris]|uniref:Methyltransferase domain-containing protein n=1 Tax=Hypsibius exemplaris TaxID=2072580 RepID=A0A1W0WIB5_HYPEX|nr:hypothetical protein BV898_10854 [Hypsibius exemplaris]
MTSATVYRNCFALGKQYLHRLTVTEQCASGRRLSGTSRQSSNRATTESCRHSLGGLNSIRSISSGPIAMAKPLDAQPTAISAEHTGIFTPTLNKMGWQQNSLDEYLSDFVDYAGSPSRTRPVADVGAAFGFVSQKLLERGATVLMNDLEPGHLEDIVRRISPEERERLTCIPGSVFDLKLEEGSLDGIVAARMTQFFPVADIRRFFDLAYKWLAQGGRLCVTNTSPWRGTTEAFQREYERKCQQGEEWPGITTTDSLDQNRQKRITLPQTGYRFDPAVLRREAERVGFRVVRTSFYPTPFLPDEFRSADGIRDAVGLIAEK